MMNCKKTVWIDLFEKGKHRIEKHNEKCQKRLLELMQDGWAISASIFSKEKNRIYITLYRPEQ